MERRFESGIPVWRIEAFLGEELALPQMADGSYLYKEASVQAEPLAPRRLGCVEISRTALVLHGAQADIQEFERRFLMRFLSAGG